ncbi:hypothetical protein MYP_4468 [Sporocytophaga myxococcoides]|uniref:DUF4350 domain-containing protein n=1 Tax=Sporocytophaga myxococcoides TaxID=153721 RepID=A0A098LMJ6_9BACT|nr:DUF4350 domain-containing protein [Sporocytophaga myxococcoides]GAL87238.1 hypothetical protein MYP_4468 [Sporocytophaga myxococcoides]
MKKKEVKYGLGLLSLFILLVIVEYNQPEPIDWSHNYSVEKKSPFGSYGLFKLLPGYFKNSKITTSRKTIYETEKEFADSTFNYIIIGDQFNPSTEDIVALKDILNKGNDVFIAASYFSNEVEDSLGFYAGSKLFRDLHISSDSLFKKAPDTIEVAFVAPYSEKPNTYKFENNHLSSVFDSLNKYPENRVLAATSKGDPVIIYKRIGNGRLFLSSFPLAYTNYYFTRPSGKSFIEKSFNFFQPDKTILWDIYYHGEVVVSTNPLRFVLGNNALRYSLYLTTLAAVLFIMFEGKRKQRIIPIIEPVTNNSLEFIRTISNLYFSKGNHKNIASKKIVYFFDHIKNHYYIQVSDPDFKKRLIAKSGMEEVKVNHLLNYIDTIKSKSSLSGEDLIKLNNLIEDFLKNCR